MFVGPTGARTEIRISPASANFFGEEQYSLGAGYLKPKSVLP
jgi:hypothetical protein